MQKVIRPLRAGSVPLDEWFRNTADTGSHAYGAALIEVISKNINKNQNVRCFTCGKQSHLERDWRQDIPPCNFKIITPFPPSFSSSQTLSYRFS